MRQASNPAVSEEHLVVSPRVSQRQRLRTSWEERLRRRLQRFENLYGAVLLLIILTILIGGFVGGHAWGRPVVVLMMAMTMQVGLSAAKVSLRVYAISWILVCLTLAVSLAGWITGIDALGGVAIAVTASVLVTVVPATIGRDLLRHLDITFRTVAGTVCIYLLVGLFFSTIYSMIEVVTGGFFAQHSHPQPIDFTYFSFITMATVGYGDFTPGGDAGKMLAVLEALIGQVYLVTVVALVVGNLGWRTMREARGSRTQEGSAADGGAPPAEGQAASAAGNRLAADAGALSVDRQSSPEAGTAASDRQSSIRVKADS